MPTSAPTPHDRAAPANDDAPDPSVLRAEQRLAMLRELAEIGMELARELRPGASAEAGHNRRDPAEAFAPLSRAIRLTLALEAKIDAELRDLKPGTARETEGEQRGLALRARTAEDQFFHERRANLRHLVREAAEAEIVDAEALDEIRTALEQHLQFDFSYQNIAERPLRESVERLCADLKLNPDWGRWNADSWRPAVGAAKPRDKPPRPQLE